MGTDRLISSGTWAIEVDPRGTSVRCSACGADVPKTLSDRVHTCVACGLEVDRDLNGARNILALALGGSALRATSVAGRSSN